MCKSCYKGYYLKTEDYLNNIGSCVEKEDTAFTSTIYVDTPSNPNIAYS